MQNIWTNRSLSDEEKALFNFYGIRGYDCDAPGLLDGATPANYEHTDDDHDQGLSGDTPGHSEG